MALSILFAPKVPKPEDGKVPFNQSVPPRIRIIGRRRTAGAFMLYHGTKGGTFYGISALCEGPANAFIRFYLHDDVVEIEADGYTVASRGDGSYGDDKIQIYTRLGVNPETAYDEAVDGLDPIWTVNHRLDGICSALLIANDAGADDQGKRFPFGLPVLSVVVDATQVYDPREAAVQDWADPETWFTYEASENPNSNPILQAVWHLTAPISQGGMGLDFEEAFLPVLADVAVQADVCDERVPIKGGGEPTPRYRSGALYHFSDDPGDVLAAILGTCDGFCAENGDGTFTLKAGKWDDDDFSVVIQDRHIISLNVKRFKPDEDEVTGVIVKYNSVEHEHTMVDAPVWPRDAYQGGNDKRIRPIEVSYCPDGRQAQRLGKRVATYEMATVTGTAVLKMYGILLINKRGATIQCTDDPALADCKVRLTRVEPNLMNGTVEIDFQVFDPVECDAWDAETEEGPLQRVVTVPVEGSFTAPSSLVLSAYELGSITYVDISFDPGDVAGPNTRIAYRGRIADIGGGVPGPWSINGEIAPDSVDRTDPLAWVITIANVPTDTRLEFQIQAHQHDYSAWSTLEIVDTTYPQPGRVSELAAEYHEGIVTITFTAPNSTNFDHANVYRAATGTAFALATRIGEVAGAPNADLSFDDTTVSEGTFDYWVTAATAESVASLPRGPVTVVISALDFSSTTLTFDSTLRTFDEVN